MAKYFIDCGGHKTQSVLYAMKNFPEYKIIVFECDLRWQNLYKDLPVILHTVAVWIKGGEIEFYRAGHSAGSTIMKGKTTGNIDYKNPIKVPCIDFSEWLGKYFKKEDNVILKLNIEGAEVPILKKLIKDGTIGLIDKLYCNFHAKKFEKKLLSEEQELIKQLKAFNLQPELWNIPHGQNYYPHGW